MQFFSRITRMHCILKKIVVEDAHNNSYEPVFKSVQLKHTIVSLN